MTKQLYRKVGICAILGCASLTLAQSPHGSQKPRTGPRAISVLEMDSNGHARMVPVTIILQGRFYDAAQYQANPVPMAAEPGNVYDVMQANLPIGLFTTADPKQVGGEWVSGGRYQVKSDEPVKKKPAKVEVSLGDKSDGPVLKRHGEPSPSGPDKNAPPADDDSDRPTLKKSQQSAPEPESAPSSASSDKTPQIAKTTAQPVDTNLQRDENSSDPDRPVLKKTAAGANPSEVNVTMPDPVKATRVAAPEKVAPQNAPDQLKSYIAISDEEKTDYRPFAFQLKEDEKPAFIAKMQKVAAFNLQKWALAHGGVKLDPKLTFTDFDLRAYDVDYSNNPELIFTASYSPVATAKTKPVTYYITFVARTDYNGEPNPLFSQITDSTRLDAYARLELIDAVDADGYGRGSLLFREYTDSGKAFILYRVDGYNLTKQFEGASGE